MKPTLFFIFIAALSTGIGILMARIDVCAAGGYYHSCAGYNAVSLFIGILFFYGSYTFLKSTLKIVYKTWASSSSSSEQ